MESVKSAKDERLRETRNAMHVMQAKLDEQLKIKLDALNGMSNHLCFPRYEMYLYYSPTFTIFS